MLAVFVKRGGADGLEFTAGQHWLQHLGRVNRALSCTCPNKGVDLIDENDDVTAGLDLFQDLLETFFKVTAVAGTGNQRPHV